MNRTKVPLVIGLLLIGVLVLFKYPGAAASPRAEDGLSQVEDAEAILDNLERLHQKQSDAALKPGWLHLVYEVKADTDEANNGELSNGQEIPLNYILDEWYYLDGQGMVLEAVTLMLSLDGKVLQASTFQEGTWQNLTVDEKFKVTEPFTISLDFDFLADMQKAYANNSVLLQSSVEFDGVDSLLFTMSDTFDKPLQAGSYAQPIIQAEKRAILDADSGEILSLETVFVMADGTVRISLSITPLTLENVSEPPDSILLYLTNK